MPRQISKALGAGDAPLPGDVAAKITHLDEHDVQALAAEWHRLYRRPPPPDITRDLLLRGVAHALQLAALGGLSPAAAWRLKSLANPSATESRRAPNRLRPGTSLVREWHGETHTVLTREGGYEYQGRVYRSLSLIAREITRAHWSGPRFFRLNPRSRPRPATAVRNDNA